MTPLRSRSTRVRRRFDLCLDQLEGRQLLSTIHKPVATLAHEMGAAHAPAVVQHQAAVPSVAHRAAMAHSPPSLAKADTVPTPAPVPNALLPYENISIVNAVQAPGQPYYSSFQMYGKSADWGADGILDYFSYTVAGKTTYYYSIFTQDRGGTWSKLISSPAPYYSPQAPTWLVLSSPHYSPLYANPVSSQPHPGGPGSGGTVNTDPSTFLPAPFNHVTGNLIPGTGHYSSFQVGGNNPAKGSTILIGYVTGNPYGVDQYYWSVYIHSPILGNIGYQEVDYSPYYTTGLPGGVSAFVHQYLGYL
jgi:hypothetical protein